MQRISVICLSGIHALLHDPHSQWGQPLQDCFGRAKKRRQKPSALLDKKIFLHFSSNHTDYLNWSTATLISYLNLTISMFFPGYLWLSAFYRQEKKCILSVFTSNGLFKDVSLFVDCCYLSLWWRFSNFSWVWWMRNWERNFFAHKSSPKSKSIFSSFWIASFYLQWILEYVMKRKLILNNSLIILIQNVYKKPVLVIVTTF